MMNTKTIMATTYYKPFLICINSKPLGLLAHVEAMGSEKTASARKVMVVADPTRESAAALQYALSHVVLENDELILLHVENPSSWRNTFSFLKRPSLSNSSIPNSSGNGGGVLAADIDFLEEMKQVCEVVQPKFLEEMKQVAEVAQPKIRVQIERMQVEAKDKANAILNKSKQLGADLLIIGQRRSLSNAILGYKRPGGSGKGFDMADYLIENSKCTCVAVQKKSQNAGYLLNTKTHKNFWLLA